MAERGSPERTPEHELREPFLHLTEASSAQVLPGHARDTTHHTHAGLPAAEDLDDAEERSQNSVAAVSPGLLEVQHSADEYIPTDWLAFGNRRSSAVPAMLRVVHGERSQLAHDAIALCALAHHRVAALDAIRTLVSYQDDTQLVQDLVQSNLLSPF
jgi:hypothetical protein